MAAEPKRRLNHLADLRIIPFKFKHHKSLLELYASRGLKDNKDLAYRTLPKVGFIAFLGDQPVAAGFLRRLEPSYGQIDGLVSSSYYGSLIRHEAITRIVDSLIEEGKRLKLDGILALTDKADVLSRAEDLGFKPISVRVLALPLK